MKILHLVVAAVITVFLIHNLPFWKGWGEVEGDQETSWENGVSITVLIFAFIAYMLPF
jgi:hypothetical protein